MEEHDDLLAKLRGEFIRLTTERLNTIEQLLARLSGLSGEVAARMETLQEVQRHFHSLVGSGKTFGFPNITTIALHAETACTHLIAQQGAPQSAELSRLHEWTLQLRRELAAG